jgi:hypothetical protein
VVAGCTPKVTPFRFLAAAQPFNTAPRSATTIGKEFWPTKPNGGESGKSSTNGRTPVTPPPSVTKEGTMGDIAAVVIFAGVIVFAIGVLVTRSR